MHQLEIKPILVNNDFEDVFQGYDGALFQLVKLVVIQWK